MKKLTTQEILDGIRSKKSNVLQLVYKENYPVVENFILRNSGKSVDAEDIFQETIVIIYRRIINDKIKLDCSFNTFLFSITKILWHEELRRKKKLNEKQLIDETTGQLDDNLLSIIEDFNKPKLVQKHLLKISPKCRKLLMLFYSNVSLKEIAKKLGFTSTNYVKKRKANCKKILIELIKSDPNYQEIMNSD